MNEYQFNQVARRMANKYGKIKKGSEMNYDNLLFPMEANSLKIQRMDKKITDRVMIEGIMLTLHELESRLEINELDVSKFETPKNLKIKNALLMVFDPFTNKNIAKYFKKKRIKLNVETLEMYYQEPVMCLLRIKDSVDTWTKRYGSTGYFQYLESVISPLVPYESEII